MAVACARLVKGLGSFRRRRVRRSPSKPYFENPSVATGALTPCSIPGGSRLLSHYPFMEQLPTIRELAVLQSTAPFVFVNEHKQATKFLV